MLEVETDQIPRIRFDDDALALETFLHRGIKFGFQLEILVCSRLHQPGRTVATGPDIVVVTGGQEDLCLFAIHGEHGIIQGVDKFPGGTSQCTAVKVIRADPTAVVDQREESSHIFAARHRQVDGCLATGQITTPAHKGPAVGGHSGQGYLITTIKIILAWRREHFTTATYRYIQGKRLGHKGSRHHFAAGEDNRGRIGYTVQTATPAGKVPAQIGFCG